MSGGRASGLQILDFQTANPLAIRHVKMVENVLDTTIASVLRVSEEEDVNILLRIAMGMIALHRLSGVATTANAKPYAMSVVDRLAVNYNPLNQLLIHAAWMELGNQI